MEKVLKLKLGVVNDLMEIEKAGDFCMKSNPSKAPKFFDCIKNTVEAFEKGDVKKAFSLIDGIMPDVDEIVGAEEAKSGMIYKDIAR